MLIRHALRLRGVETAYSKREAVEQARAEFRLDAAPFLSLLDLRDGKLKPKELDPVSLYGRYLEQIGTVIAVVDRIREVSRHGGCPPQPNEEKRKLLTMLRLLLVFFDGKQRRLGVTGLDYHRHHHQL